MANISLERLDEKVIHLQREVENLKSEMRVQFEEVKIDQARDHQEVKSLIKNMMEQMDKKVENASSTIKEHSTELTKLKRDRAWVHGIFIAMWSFTVAWVKYR